MVDDLPLFSAAPPPASTPPKPRAVEDALRAAALDEMTPRAALDFLYELRAKLDD